MAAELAAGAALGSAFGFAFDRVLGGGLDKALDTVIARITGGQSCKEDAEKLKTMVNDLQTGLAQWFYLLGPSQFTEYESAYDELCDCMDDALAVTHVALGLKDRQYLEKASCNREMQSIKSRLQRFREDDFRKRLQDAAKAEVARRKDMQRNIQDIQDRLDRFNIQDRLDRFNIQDRLDMGLQVPDRPPLSKKIFQHLDKLVPDLKDMLGATRVVGIVGMAGIGKTTVVKQVFDEMKRHFTYAYVMVVSSTPDLLNLLRTAWCDIFGGTRAPFDNIEKGLEKFAEELKNKTVLLLLDDVWDPEHLRILNFATRDGESHDKSRLLVTTRNPDHLGKAFSNHPREFQQVKVPFLNDKHAMELLCYNAFNGASAPPPTHADVAQAMMQECKGLPLALVVVGGGLKNKSVEEWMERFKRLENFGFKATWDKWDIMGICRPSYEELGPEGRICFKLFAGYPEDARMKEGVLVSAMAGLLPMQQHAEAHTKAQTCLKDLCRRGLALVDEFGEYYMHDVLRDLAVSQVQKTRQLFLLDDKALEEVCKEPRKTYANVRHLSLKDNADPAKWPAAFGLVNLRVLDLSKTKVETLPSVFTMSPHLKVLIMWHCDKLKRLPEDISTLIGLKELHLKDCESLEELPQGISALTGLEILDLGGCGKLSELPEGIFALARLKELNLGWCSSRTVLPESISKLTGLEKLDLGGCGGLKELPLGIAALIGLVKLNLSDCITLIALPEGISALTGLKELNLGNCEGLEVLPAGISALTGLKVLDLGSCEMLKELPVGISALTGLEKFNLLGCLKLAALPAGLSDLTGLKELVLGCGMKLEVLPEGISALAGLEKLNLRDCKGLTVLPAGISALTGLRSLDLGRCESLTALPDGISALTGLKELNLSGCKRLAVLPAGISALAGLKELNLSGCKRLAVLPAGISALAVLEQLHLRDCTGLTVLPAGISALTGLWSLDLWGCNQTVQDDINLIPLDGPVKISRGSQPKRNVP